MTQRIHQTEPLAGLTLRTRRIDDILPFYTEQLGLALHERTESSATLGSDPSLEDDAAPYFYLTEDPDAADAPQEAGLFHTAFLFSHEGQLADALVSIAEHEGRLDGVADHGVSHALYLHDPDGNGVEIYWDLPREQWPTDAQGNLIMYTEPLDVDALLAKRTGASTHIGRARLGHVHLRVHDIAAATDFYVDQLGFDLVTRFGDSAGFVSVQGYHHHLGYNTWQRSRPRTSAASNGLAKLSLYAAGPEPAELQDPSGIPVELVPHP